MRTGDRVLISCDGRSVPGQILLASKNGRSLMLTFEAILAGHVGMMPVLQGPDGDYRSVVSGAPIGLKRVPNAKDD